MEIFCPSTNQELPALGLPTGKPIAKVGIRLSGYSLSTSSTTVQYHTIVDIVLYNESGEAVRSQSKESVWPNDNAYDMTFR